MNEFAVHNVPVFQKDLAAVYNLLSARNATSAPADTGTSTAGGSWNEAEMIALHDRCKPGHRAVLTKMAEAGVHGASAMYEELRVVGADAAKNPDFSFHNMRGNLAWISKYMLKVKGTTEGLFTFTDNGPGLPSGERYEYRMSKETAQLWLAVAKERAMGAFSEMPKAE